MGDSVVARRVVRSGKVRFGGSCVMQGVRRVKRPSCAGSHQGQSKCQNARQLHPAVSSQNGVLPCTWLQCTVLLIGQFLAKVHALLSSTAAIALARRAAFGANVLISHHFRGVDRPCLLQSEPAAFLSLSELYSRAAQTQNGKTLPDQIPHSTKVVAFQHIEPAARPVPENL